MYVLFIYLLLVIICIYDLISNKKIPKKFQVILMLLIFVFFGFRFGLGSDTRTYVTMFEHMTPNLIEAFLSPSRFPLYNLIESIFKNLNLSFPVFLLVLQSFSLSLIGYTVFKESKNILLSILIVLGAGFVESYMTSMIRQMFCMAVFFFAFYKYLRKEKYLEYYLVFTPMVLIHWACIPLLFVPLMYKFRSCLLTKKSVILTIVASFIGCIVIYFWLDLILEYMPSYMSLLFSGTRHDFRLSGLLLRVVLFLIVGGLYFLGDNQKDDEFDKFQVYFCLISLLMYLMLANNAIISRMCDFIEMIHIILIPSLLFKISSKKKRFVCLMIIVSLNGVLLISDIKFNLEHWFFEKSIIAYPYVSLLDANDSVKYYSFHEIPQFAK